MKTKKIIGFATLIAGLFLITAFALVLAGCDSDNGGTKKYKVTFNENKPEGVTAEITGMPDTAGYSGLSSGVTIGKPTDPELEGYQFDGWYKEKETANAWNFSGDTVTKNIILYAKWTIKDPSGGGEEENGGGEEENGGGEEENGGGEEENGGGEEENGGGEEENGGGEEENGGGEEENGGGEEETPPLTEGLMIFQVYGAGNVMDNSPAASHSFIELYNNSNAAIVLSGFSVQYAEGTTANSGKMPDKNWHRINLTGSIPAKGSYLIRGDKMVSDAQITADNGGKLNLTSVTPDVDAPAFRLSNRAFKVALLSNQVDITVANPWDAAACIDLTSAINSRNNGDSIDAAKGAADLSAVNNATAGASTISKQKSWRRASLTVTNVTLTDFTSKSYRDLSAQDIEKFRPRTAAETAAGYTPEFNENNGGSAPSAVTAPVFSRNSGLHNAQFNLTLTAQAGTDIYYSIDGSIPVPSKAGGGRVFRYSAPITVKNRNGEANLLATAANIPLMYQDPNLEAEWDAPRPYPTDPREYAPYINFEDWEKSMPKATVIRAMAVDSGGKQSDVVTKTYFIGDNLANYGNHPVLSIITDPVNLLDDETGIYVRGLGTDRETYNYHQKGREWEREAYLDFFEGNGSRNLAFSTGVGIRPRGGATRENGQKSLNVYFREEYGINNLSNYNLIPGAVRADGKTPLARYKNFMLRNGGNDTTLTKMRDLYVQSLVKDRNFTTQAGIPCILYLNGEYWGPYNLQEKYSDNHLEYKYGTDRNNVIAFKIDELDEGIPADEVLYHQLQAFADKDFSTGGANNQNYIDFCNIMDIQSFIDFWAAEMYVFNEDRPGNNFYLWRVRTPNTGNLPYSDGKWRYMLYDADFTMGLYSGGGQAGQYKDADPTMNTFRRILEKFGLNPTDGPDNHWQTLLFNALWENAGFKKQFVLTMLDLRNNNFKDWESKLNTMVSIYRPLMGTKDTAGTYFSRWGYPWGWNYYVFDDQVNNMKKFMREMRDLMVDTYLPTYAGATGSLVNVTLGGPANFSIRLNEGTIINLASGSWTGQYYADPGLPITIEAIAPNGAPFTSWTLTGGGAIANPAASKTAVTLTGDAVIMLNWSSAASTVTVNFKNTFADETINLDNFGSAIRPNGSLLVNLPEDGSYGWYVDGKWQEGNGFSVYYNAPYYAVEPDWRNNKPWAAGRHTLTVKFDRNGIPYSKTVYFRVTQ